MTTPYIVPAYTVSDYRAMYARSRDAVVKTGKITAVAFKARVQAELNAALAEQQERTDGPRPEPTPEMWAAAACQVHYSIAPYA